MDPDAVYHAQLRPMLQDYLRGHGSHAGVRIINAGIGGNTSREGLARLEPDVLRYRPDITVVCFGLNDVHGGDAGLGAYQDCLREIFRALRRAGSMPVFMTPNMMCTGTTARYAACPPLREMQAHCCALQLNGQVDRYMQAARDVFLLISTHFTATLGIPLTSPALKTNSFQCSPGVEPLPFTSDLPLRLRSLYTQ